MRTISILLLALGSVGADDRSVQLESFDQVWKTVAEKHWNPKQLEKLPGGASWEGIREGYRDRVSKAVDQTQVRAILREMLTKIGKSHYAVSGYDGPASKAMRQGGGTAPDFRVALVGKSVLVTRVREGGMAAAAGVQVGWELRSVSGTPLAPVIAEMQAKAANTLHYELRLHQTLTNQISGYSGQTLDYDFSDAQDTVRKVSLEIPPQDGSQGFGFMQGMNVEREFRKVGRNRDVGYFRIELFLDVVRVLPEFQKAVMDCATCKGFVIDLRGNPGGIAIMANAMAGWFVKDSGVKLGTMYQRGLDLNFVIIPRLNGFAGPLAVLVDGASASTSEILAGGLQDLKRARIFGNETAGAALPSVIESLPNGDLFQYAIANYVSESGKELEGRGVTPDQLVRHTRQALLSGKDLPLNAAIDWVYANTVPPSVR